MLRPAPSSPRDPALPGWVTADLIARTRATWQPYYPEQPLTDDDAVQMLLTVANLYRVLAGEQEDDDRDHSADDEAEDISR